METSVLRRAVNNKKTEVITLTKDFIIELSGNHPILISPPKTSNDSINNSTSNSTDNSLSSYLGRIFSSRPLTKEEKINEKIDKVRWINESILYLKREYESRRNLEELLRKLGVPKGKTVLYITLLSFGLFTASKFMIIAA